MGLKGNYKSEGLNVSERYIKIAPKAVIKLRGAIEVYESKSARDSKNLLRAESISVTEDVKADIEAYATKAIYEYAKKQAKFSGLEDVFEPGQEGYIEPVVEEPVEEVVEEVVEGDA